MSAALSPDLLPQLSQFIGSRMGLHFPRERWGDLAKGLASAAGQQGSGSAEAYVRRLLSSPLTRREIETLASHLTVGETYFFREKGTFDALEQHVLPELIRLRRSNGKRLRIWSAGCCTGEEPYSMAILLDGMIPDLADWNVTILATDINPRFLDIACDGVYGDWSFRAIPPGIKKRYFSPAPGGKQKLARRIRQMVSFSFLNLAQDAYPSLMNNTNAMDVVLCRNVLMYFTQQQAVRVAANLVDALVEGGWLLVAPSETSQVLFKRLSAVSFPESIFYRKSPGGAPPQAIAEEAVPVVHDLPCVTPEPPALEEAALPVAPEPSSPDLVARALANEGKLEEALTWCDRAVASETLNPAHRFLRAMVARELGMLDEAMRFLEETLYLDSDFIMAHVALGGLAKKLGRHRQFARHLRIALALLSRVRQDEPLPESAGLTAGRLTEVIHATSEGDTQS